MDLLTNFGWVALGLVLLYFGAEWLVKGASELAVRMGVSPLVVGLTVVAFGTSAPELMVSIKANMAGQGGLALGNVVGSNICNLCLVLGAGAVIFPLKIHRQVILKEMPVLLVASVVLLLMLRNGVVSQTEGGILAAGIVFYLVFSLRQAKKEPLVIEGLSEKELREAREAGAGRVFLDVLLVVAGIVLLVFGADFLVRGGSELARSFGVSEAVIGLTLVAFGTSLPELATSVVAAKRGEGDIVVGNAVGSCIFNILTVVGLTALIKPLAQSGLTWTDLYTMLGVTVVALLMMWVGKKLSRWEGWVLLAGYVGYLAWLAQG